MSVENDLLIWIFRRQYWSVSWEPLKLPMPNSTPGWVLKITWEIAKLNWGGNLLAVIVSISFGRFESQLQVAWCMVRDRAAVNNGCSTGMSDDEGKEEPFARANQPQRLHFDGVTTGDNNQQQQWSNHYGTTWIQRWGNNTPQRLTTPQQI